MNNTSAFRFRAMGGRRPWPNALAELGQAGRLFVTLVGLLWSGLLVSRAADWYVATNGTGYGTSWADATNSLQGAINAISGTYPTNTVWVSNGVYEAGGITNFPTGTVLTNRIAIYKAITVQAFSTNPADTLIKGQWHDGYPGGPVTNKFGPAAVRCVWMTNNSKLIGFTLTNGATFASGANVERGGGVSCQSTNTTISNCVLTGNSAGLYGGGVIYGTLFNCSLTSNSAYYGGGIYGGTLFNCTLTRNSAGLGAGSYSVILYNCISWSNSMADFSSTYFYSTTNDPLFITNGSGYGSSHVAGNYRLRNVSPPLNAGTNFSWMTDPNDVRSKDLDGLRRIDRFSGQVDMGCYELMPAGTMFIGH